MNKDLNKLHIYIILLGTIKFFKVIYKKNFKSFCVVFKYLYNKTDLINNNRLLEN